MRDAGVKVLVDMAGGGTIGISETLKSLPAVACKYLRFRRMLLDRRPDVFVPIDFGAFNVRLAQVACRSGIQVVYYFPPSSWRRRPKNAAKLHACGGRVITPFPWSAELLCAEGIDARFVGHPLIDVVKPGVGRAGFLREVGLPDSVPTIGLLPGSRGHEIREHLSPMLGCARIMHRELGGAQFVIAAANRSEEIREQVRAAGEDDDGFPPVRVVEGRAYDCMAASDFLIAASGTATLEAAILGVPMVIVYKGSPLMRFEFLFRKSVLEEYIGMPNIVADRGVCPELINDDVTAEKLADIALSLMRDDGQVAKMKASLAEVRARLGEPGAVERAAHTLLEMGALA